MKKNIIISIIACVVLIGLIFSCTDEESVFPSIDSISKSDSDIPPSNMSIKDITFDFGPFTSTDNIHIFSSEDLNYCKYSLKHKDFTEMYSYFNIDQKDQVISYMLFKNGLVNDADVVSKSEVIAIGTYTLIQNDIYFNLYILNENNSVNVPELSSRVSGFSITDLLFIAKRLIPKIDNGGLSIIRISDSEFDYNSLPKLRYSQDNLLVNAFLLDKKNKRLNFKLKTGNRLLDFDRDNDVPVTCGGSCTENNDDYCSDDINPVQYPICQRCLICCLDDFEEDVEDSGEISLDTVNTAFDQDLLYDFRDSVLKYTYWGLKIIKYYYWIQDFIDFDNVPLSLKLETTYALYDFIPKASKIINYDSFRNDTVLSHSLKSDLVTLMNNYKTLSSDTTYIAILNDIIDDINYYYDETIDDFIDETVADTDYQQ